MKKKITFVILALMVIATMSLHSFASNSQYIYTIENTTVIFDEATTLNEESRLHIANLLVNGDDGTTTYGLMCTLFGHKLESNMVSTITHCVEATDPRCLEETYLVDTCTRCDYATTERIGYGYITCCPVE